MVLNFHFLSETTEFRSILSVLLVFCFFWAKIREKRFYLHTLLGSADYRLGRKAGKGRTTARSNGSTVHMPSSDLEVKAFAANASKLLAEQMAVQCRWPKLEQKQFCGGDSFLITCVQNTLCGFAALLIVLLMLVQERAAAAAAAPQLVALVAAVAATAATTKAVREADAREQCQ